MSQNVPFLCDCFPHLERSQINDIVRKNPGKSVDQICSLLLTQKRKPSPSIHESRHLEPATKKRKQPVVINIDDDDDVEVLTLPIRQPKRKKKNPPKPAPKKQRQVNPPRRRLPAPRTARNRSEMAKFMENVHSNRINMVSSNPQFFDSSKKYNQLEEQKEKFRINKLHFESELHAHRRKHAERWRGKHGGPKKGGGGGGAPSSSSQNPRIFMTLNTLPDAFENLPTYPTLSGPSSRVHDISSLTARENDPKKIGVDSLRFTNEFRKKKGLPELKWNEELYKIGMNHSVRMGDKKCPFGHHGFNGRMNEMTKKCGAVSGAENVAWTSSPINVAKETVNGWINSPGHRKNMVSRQRFCAISVYKNREGRFYLTQLFCR